MNKREAAIITAFTGISFGGESFSEFHKYVEEKFGCAIFTHDMADKNFWNSLREFSRQDFLDLSNSIE